MRSYLTSRSLLAVLGCVVAMTFSACEVGTVPQGGGGGGSGGPDAGGSGGGSDGSPAGNQPDAGGGNANCDDQVTVGLTDGHHNAGLTCIQAGCHAPGGEGPTYTAAGTAYKGAGTATPYVGGTVHLIDANGNDIALVTQANGNFYTSQALAFPLTTSISSCPYTLGMSAQVQTGQGSCNQAGCHDANLPISLP